MANLRIGIDAHQLGRRQTGNERVMMNLVTELGRLSDHEIVLYFTNRELACEWAKRANGRYVCKTLAARSPHVRVPVLLPLAAYQDGLDVLLCHMVSPPVRPCPVVTLVHDVAFRRHPKFFSIYDRVFLNCAVPASVRWSNAIVAVSNFTRNELIDVYDVPPAKIFVAPNGVDATIFARPQRVPRRETRYFLAIGNLQPRKNLPTLIQAYAELISSDSEVAEKLIVVGQPAYGAADIVSVVPELAAMGRVEFTGFVDDDELISLIQGATALAYPSVYEGFGLPPLEAMAAGTPVIASDIPVMREVVGDSGVLVPAQAVDCWAAALGQMASDAEFRIRLASAGIERARSFTWEQSGLAVLKALSLVAA